MSRIRDGYAWMVACAGYDAMVAMVRCVNFSSWVSEAKDDLGFAVSKISIEDSSMSDSSKPRVITIAKCFPSGERFASELPGSLGNG
jgi:hypothetical protein